MSATTYALHLFDTVLTDGEPSELWLHDIATDPEELRLQALVASGDYFETLAARLEQIATALPIKSVEQYQLQDAVGQLLYLQRGYTIKKKTISR